jgi:arginine repressor
MSQASVSRILNRFRLVRVRAGVAVRSNKKVELRTLETMAGLIYKLQG